MPQLRATGVVAASLRLIGDDPVGQWQFNEPDVLAMFLDWRGAQQDIAFADEQRDRLQTLNEARISAKRRVVERLERLVAAGTDTRADLETASADLLELEIEGAKELHQAEAEKRKARLAEAVVVRKLQLIGLDPDLLMRATKDVDVVVADIPEAFVDRVKLGQECTARFLGLKDHTFTGMVSRIAPTLTLERRSLRVLFFVDDPDDRLRPGMFAEIGLGTEERQTILVPATAVVHVGRDDFVFVQSAEAADEWRVMVVEVGDTSNGQVEILAGLAGGETIIVAGAILLKPVAIDSLRRSKSTTAAELSAAEVDPRAAGGETPLP